MEDNSQMKIVISLDEEEYRAISINKGIPYHLSPSIGGAILNGISLPEHHGDLIDREELHYHCNYNNGLGCDKICHCDGCVHNVIQERTVNAVPTIIPATRKEDDNADNN